MEVSNGCHSIHTRTSQRFRVFTNQVLTRNYNGPKVATDPATDYATAVRKAHRSESPVQWESHVTLRCGANDRERESKRCHEPQSLPGFYPDTAHRLPKSTGNVQATQAPSQWRYKPQGRDSERNRTSNSNTRINFQRLLTFEFAALRDVGVSTSLLTMCNNKTPTPQLASATKLSENVHKQIGFESQERR